MRHALATLMLLLLMGSATGGFAVLAESDLTCGDDCDDWDSDTSSSSSGCPPGCDSCLCAARGMSLEPPGPIALPTAAAAGEAVMLDGLSGPACSDPREILHVPRRAGRVDIRELT